MELLQEYKNGNYTVKIYSDGTKELYTEDDVFDAVFPDSIDLKITNRCDLMCPMCHEESSPQGAHGNLDAEFLNTLHAGTELAIGGGNPLAHPALLPFLYRLKSAGVIANITVNERHLHRYRGLAERLIKGKLVYGLGISLCEYREDTFAFARSHSNSVLHVIAGIVRPEEILAHASRRLKLLILGYKQRGRGKEYFSSEIKERIAELDRDMGKIMDAYGVVSFDNLALRQLNIKEWIPKDEWDGRFMGDDGTNTMYVDLVKNEFAVSSTSDLRYPISDSVEAMFAVVKSNRNV